MSSEWQEVALGDVANTRNGAGIKQDFFASEGIPLARVSNFTDSSIDMAGCIYVHADHALKWENHRLRKGDVIVATVGSWPPNWSSVVGKTIRVPVGAVGALQNQNTCCVIALEEKADQRFLYYVLRADEFRFFAANSASGSANQARLPIDKLKNFKFMLPSLGEQKEISTLLGSLDDRIALLRETNTTLEAIAQAMFKSWFVDFDPVRAKQEGRDPEGMDADTAALFPDSFEESELGIVPKGWKLVPFGELLCQTTGGDWGSDLPDEINDTRVAIIRGTDIPDLQTASNSRVPVRYTSQKKLITRRLQDGDIVLEVSGGSKDQPTGRALYLTSALLGQFDCPVEPASFCRLLRPNSKNIGVILGQHLTYIYAQGKTWEYQNQSTGISNFQTVHFLKTELVVLPPENILSAFCDTVRPMIDRSHLTQIKQLATLRDTLLPRLISGQLRLPDAETLIEEATV